MELVGLPRTTSDLDEIKDDYLYGRISEEIVQDFVRREEVVMREDGELCDYLRVYWKTTVGEGEANAC